METASKHGDRWDLIAQLNPCDTVTIRVCDGLTCRYHPLMKKAFSTQLITCKTVVLYQGLGSLFQFVDAVATKHLLHHIQAYHLLQPNLHTRQITQQRQFLCHFGQKE